MPFLNISMWLSLGSMSLKLNSLFGKFVLWSVFMTQISRALTASVTSLMICGIVTLIGFLNLVFSSGWSIRIGEIRVVSGGNRNGPRRHIPTSNLRQQPFDTAPSGTSICNPRLSSMYSPPSFVTTNSSTGLMNDRGTWDGSCFSGLEIFSS